MRVSDEMRVESRENLFTWTRGFRMRYGVAIAALALSILASFGVPLVVQEAIDGVLGADPEAASGWLQRWSDGLGLGGSTSGVLAVGVACLLGLTVLSGALQYLQGRWAAQASEGIVRSIRDRVFGHFEALPCAYHDTHETGDLVQRATSDVETVRMFLASQVVEIGRAVFLLLGAVPILIHLDARLALYSVALFPPIMVFAWIFFHRVRDRFKAMDESEGAMTSVLQENLTGVRVVRAFARQEFECEKFAEKNAEFRDRNDRLLRLLGIYWSVSDLLCLSQIGIVLLMGAQACIDGSLSVGTLFAFLTYEGLVIWPVRHMGRVLTDLGKATVALGRIREVLESAAEVDEEGAIELESAEGHLEFRDLRFRYGEGEEVLRGLSWTVRAGETLAILGPPGSGKTTLLQILLRLYEPTSGQVLLDGKELRRFTRASVRAQVGVVLQDPFLYSKTVADNLRVGRSASSREEIVEAAQDACVHGSIEGFDKGYDTRVGERGVTLSGGQRQRVALARALLKNPAVLLLDDSLSAVDTRTEAEILAALERRRGRRTTLIVSHRLSSVVHADRIVVLEEGAIVQSGTHEELRDAEGPYRRLWRIQGALEDEMGREVAETRRTGGPA